MKRPGFSSSPDRAAAIAERMERERRHAGRLAFERNTDRAREELGRCLAAGLTSWREIAPRLRALLQPNPLAK